MGPTHTKESSGPHNNKESSGPHQQGGQWATPTRRTVGHTNKEDSGPTHIKENSGPTHTKEKGETPIEFLDRNSNEA